MNSDGRVDISRHVQFNEAVFPYAAMFLPPLPTPVATSSSSTKPQVLLPPSSLLKTPKPTPYSLAHSTPPLPSVIPSSDTAGLVQFNDPTPVTPPPILLSQLHL